MLVFIWDFSFDLEDDCNILKARSHKFPAWKYLTGIYMPKNIRERTPEHTFCPRFVYTFIERPCYADRAGREEVGMSCVRSCPRISVLINWQDFFSVVPMELAIKTRPLGQILVLWSLN